MKAEPETPKKLLNRDLLLPYAVPYFIYVGIASLSQDRIPPEIAYILKIVLVPLALWWGWKWYVPILGPKKKLGSILVGIGFGIAGFAIWCLLMAPFIDIKGEAWTDTSFFLRAFAAVAIVPVFEEYFIRGYIFRLALQWDQHRPRHSAISALSEAMDSSSIDDVAPGSWSVMAIAVSSIAFTAGHLLVEWPAAIAYSILISVLWIIRKDLLSCMVAHGVTNLFLAVYVYMSGNWGFW